MDGWFDDYRKAKALCIPQLIQVEWIKYQNERSTTEDEQEVEDVMEGSE